MGERTRWAERARGGKRWTAAEASDALAALSQSGKSMAAFAAAHGMVAQRLSWWRRRLKASPTPERRLVPISVTTAPMISFGTTAVTVTIGEVRIEIEDPARVPASWLASVVSALRGGAE